MSLIGLEAMTSLNNLPAYRLTAFLIPPVAIGVLIFGLVCLWAITSCRRKGNPYDSDTHHQPTVPMTRQIPNNDLETRLRALERATPSPHANGPSNSAGGMVSIVQPTSTTLCNPTRPVTAHTINTGDLDRRVTGSVLTGGETWTIATADTSRRENDEELPPYTK